MYRIRAANGRLWTWTPGGFIRSRRRDRHLPIRWITDGRDGYVKVK